MFVSVIIPVFNDCDRLMKCLKALYLQTYPYSSYEIIVIDNNSTENIYSVCKQFPNVRYETESKQGSYAARNKGLSVAKGDVVAFTDSDCIPDTDWLTAGVRALSETNVGLVAGHIQFFSERDHHSVAEYVDSCIHLQQKVYAQQGYGATANVFTWRSMLDKVGLFEEVVSLGDRDFGLKVKAAGFEVIYSPDAIVLHPARNLKALLNKVHRTAQGKTYLGWKDALIYLLPQGWRFWRNVARDRNLPTLANKLRFAYLMHYVRWITALKLIQSFIQNQ